MPTNNVLTAEARATIMDACQSISRSADALKAGCAIDGEWPDAEDKAFYDGELLLLERLTALLSAHPPQPIANDAPVAQRHSWTTTGMKRDPQGHWVIASHVGVPEPRAEAADDDKRDAERYRWLRTYPNNVNAEVYGPTGGLLRRDTFLDAAIDAARAGDTK